MLSLYLLAYASFGGCRSNRKVLGKNSISAPLVVEDHSELLALWAEKGIKNAVLMNIDTHDDIRWIPGHKITALQAIYQAKDWRRFREANSNGDAGLYNIGNWIYAGARLGIFKEAYWVVPFPLLEQDNWVDILRQYLKTIGFSDDDMRTFNVEGSLFRGSFHGIPLTICCIRSLPAISEPLLLSVDIDFFPRYVADHNSHMLAALRETFDALYHQNYQVRDSAICYSVNAGYLEVRHRWVGDAVINIVHDPGIIYKTPHELLALLQKLDVAFMNEESIRMLELIDSYHHTAHRESALQLYKAFAHVMLGQTELAYSTAIDLCKADRLYCPVFPRIANYYVSIASNREAERFFSTGFSLNPAMDLGLVDFALCLRDSGKFAEAIKYMEQEVQIRGSFPVEFMITNTCIMMGDSALAMYHLQKAVSSLGNSPYAVVADKCTFDDITNVIRYCQRNGLLKKTALIVGSPEIKRMFQKFSVKK